jgi:AraC-like DNA-binding protein
MTQTPPQVTGTPDLSGSAPLGSASAADPLDLVPQVLGLVRLHGAIFFRSTFRSPWSYTSPGTTQMKGVVPGEGSLVMFHIVASGRCWIAMAADGRRHELSPGDVVVLPYSDAHSWGSFEDAAPVSIATLLPRPPWQEFPHLQYGGDGARTEVVCGYLRGDAVLFDPVLRALPALFVVHPPEGPAAAFLRASVEYAMSAGQLPYPTTGPAQKLSELLFSEVLRQYLHESADGELTGWLAALRDPVVGPALALMHAEPQRDWTVTELCRSVATSRTVLVERFHQLLGRPPIRYLTEWRLSLASGLLRTTDMGVREVASRVGYSSEEAFSRAFKRAFGSSPAHWRVGPDPAD